MIEEINSSSMKEPKIYRIGLYSKLTILINGLLITTSLMIGWALWATIGRDAIDNYIKWFNNPQQPNSNLQISFNIISIIVFIVSGLSLALVVVPFIFLKTKNSVSALFCLISFIFSAIFVIFLIVFFIFRFKTFTFLANKKDGEIINTTGNFLIAFLPWMLAELFAILLLIHSLWLIINITSKYKSNTLLMPIAKPKAKQETVIAKQEVDDTITLSNVVPIPVPQNNEEQQVANQETNNTVLKQDLTQEKIITNPSTATVHYTNHELSQTPTQGAYHAETVSPTPGTLTNLKSESITNEEEINDNIENATIYSEPTVEKTSVEDTTIYSKSPTTESNINSETNYQPKNQGGFDVKDSSYSESETSNFNEQATTITVEETQPIIEKTNTNTKKETIEVQKVTTHHWTLEQIEAVWEKAEIIDGVSDKLYRKDYGGAWMFRDSFTTDYSAADNLETYSWTIVLHRPTSQQGTTELYNLDPMNIVNAKSKGENYPSWKTKISSKGNKNIAKEQHWKART
ncbi:hypothetical protein [Spiroplasma endosymbiont of Cleonymus obscurus]|uniref:hypothetical protein n=1 Tax=Spiroplasma endosymbiont of Cleonymus obscurus TaxID=3066324 RepID=UPI0037DCCF60